MYLNHSISRQQLSFHEEKNLTHLQSVLGISDTAVNMLHTKIAALWYEKIIQKNITDGRMTLHERTALDDFARRLKLPAKQAAEISLAVRQRYMREMVQPYISRKRLSAREEQELQRIGNSLDVDVFADTSLRQQLKQFKMYWSLEHEALPVVQTTGEVVTKKEMCHFQAANVKWSETRAVGKGIQRMQLIETGTLYLTDKRILLVCASRTLTIKLEKVVKIKETGQGIEIIKDAGKNPVIQVTQQGDIAFLVLSRLVKELVV